MTASDNEILRQFLATRDLPCPHCGYNLRGLSGAACPECAQPLSIAQLDRGAERPTLVRACWGGFAYSLGTISLAAAVVVVSAEDPLDVLAVVFPGFFFLAWLVLLLWWAWASSWGRTPHVLALRLLVALSWSLGTLLLLAVLALGLSSLL